jgi:hypothetical protein
MALEISRGKLENTTISMVMIPATAPKAVKGACLANSYAICLIIALKPTLAGIVPN